MAPRVDPHETAAARGVRKDGELLVRVQFTIPYNTTFGQNLVVAGNVDPLGNWDARTGFPLTYLHPGIWTGTVELKKQEAASAEYLYCVVEGDHVEREYGRARTLSLRIPTVHKEASLATAAGSSSPPPPPTRRDVYSMGLHQPPSDAAQGDMYHTVHCRDYWRPPLDHRNIQFSDVFLRGALKPAPGHAARDYVRLDPSKYTGPVLRFNFTNPRVETGHRVIVVGNVPGLGEWSTDRGLLLTNKAHPRWCGELGTSGDETIIEYKYAIVDDKERVVCMEEGENRKINLEAMTTKTLVVVSDDWFRFGSDWRAAGVAVPVFSLRTANSGGIGEFLDIMPLVDWATRTGMKVIQLLPVNDTNSTGTWKDSYPYAPVSVFALHPIYVNLRAVGELAEPLMEQITAQRGRELNALEVVDYENVLKLKLMYLKHAFHIQKESFLASAKFKQFFADNEEWLVPYAVFCYLKELYQTPDYRRWGRFSSMTEQEIRELASPTAAQFNDIARHYFIQYHCHQQLCTAVAHARDKGVSLKGDIPIGIYRFSVDAWMYPDLFDMSNQMGTPPDAFTVTGQNWEFPCYKWDNHIQEDFAWWRRRLRKMAEYYDLFRIDHVLGFFRIWVIPNGNVTGMMGHFTPTIPITRKELCDQGVSFDYRRLCEPYIRDHVIRDFFGDEDYEFVKREYLDTLGDGIYVLKPYVDSQRKVEQLLPTVPAMNPMDFVRNLKLKNGLFRLHAELLLLPADGPPGEVFHPRFSPNLTHTFADLDQHTKDVLMATFEDYLWHRQDALWEEKARQYLPPVVAGTTMLVCAEDLGTVAPCAPRVLHSLNMTSLIIQRMPLSPTAEFWDLSSTPYLAVVSPDTHDMPTLRQWWETDRGKSERYFRQVLGHHHDPVPYFCEPWVSKEILWQHYASPSMLAIIPIQDILGMSGELRRENPWKEQINKCENLPFHYWQYRMHLNIEDLLGEKGKNLCNELHGLIVDSGRHTAY